jgi:hypothetical protein
MDFQELVTNASKAMRQETLNNSDQLTLGELILKLEPIAKDQQKIIEKYGNEASVVYDFEYLYPSNIDSWRGSYAELALNFKAEGEPLTITKFLKLLKSTIGKTFTGYKGGEFVMSKHTPLWVANYGHSGNTAVVDVLDNEYEVVLITGRREF